MSTEKRSQHCNTSQQTDWASPHRRSVNQHNSSSSPEHIALGFGHQRSLTRSDQWSPIDHVTRLGHVACFVARHSACFVTRRSSLGLLRRPLLGLLWCSLKVFHNFSPFFFLFFFLSLTLSISLSLSLSEKLKWSEIWNGSLFILLRL